MPLTVFLAHSGRTIELDCPVATTGGIEEIQEMLSTLTGIPVHDQILTHEGVPLQSLSLLSETHSDVFLYSKSFLRPDGPNPPPETLPDVDTPSELRSSRLLTDDAVGVVESTEDQKHPLDAASSPMLRALPEYKRQFRCHRRQAEAAAIVGATRISLCCRLLNEAEVQAMAVDAAMASVEPHYAFVCQAQSKFQERFARRFAFHSDILSTFDADVEFLNSITLPTQLQTESLSKLIDLVPIEELREAAKDCKKSHHRFSARVAELESLHASLRSDVEALFMKAPCVDLDALSQELSTVAAAADELTSIAQAITADCSKAEAALGDAVSISPKVPPGLQDTVGMLEDMHEAHINTALPRVAECGALIESFSKHCVDAKNALSVDALNTLRTIASQQSKIREMKESLAPFPSALDRQDAQIARLMVVRRIPAAYKQALAECVRRAAFSEKYSSFAVELSERMDRFRLKEMNMRDKFKAHIQEHLPSEFLQRMGLEELPPHCRVLIPNNDDENSIDAIKSNKLLTVDPEYLLSFKLPRYGASVMTSSVAAAAAAASIVTTANTSTQASQSTSNPAQINNRSNHNEYNNTPMSICPNSASLQLQNAQLRADLASQIALSCIHHAELATLASSSTSERLHNTQTPSPRSTSGVKVTSSLDADAAQKFEQALEAKDTLIAALKTKLEEMTANARDNTVDRGDILPSDKSLETSTSSTQT